MERIYNFSAGPATLPLSVLEEAQADLVNYQGRGLSLMEASHRGKEYSAVHEEVEANVRELMSVPDEFEVLFLTGGASTQFAMVPLNFLQPGGVADYTNSGSWAKKAIKEAGHVGKVHIAADVSGEMPARMPVSDELHYSDAPAYVHLTSNETISGTQWKAFPAAPAPLVADMSSDIMSRPLDLSPFGLIYAGAQKNLGPAGVTLVLARKSFLAQGRQDIPAIYRYQTHADAGSLYNTPPTYTIYLVMLVTRWLKEQGGVAAIAERNREKAARLYAQLDASDFYRGTAHPEHRSDMNVTFRLPSEELEAEFIAEAAGLSLSGLKGHRSVGGIRASIYNAFPVEGVDALVNFMKDFEAKHG